MELSGDGGTAVGEVRGGERQGEVAGDVLLVSTGGSMLNAGAGGRLKLELDTKSNHIYFLRGSKGKTLYGVV